MGSRGPIQKRHGRQRRDNLPAVTALADVEIERPPAPQHLLWSSRQLWARFWGSVVAQAVEINADYGSIRRWIRAHDELERLRRRVLEPQSVDEPDSVMVEDSRGREILNPLYRRIRALEGEILALEDRFGMTPLARARLGLMANTAQLTAEELRRRLDQGENGEAEPGPERQVIDAEFEAEWVDG